MSENDEPRLVTWWTPTGWVRQPPPINWEDGYLDDDEDHDARLKRLGYPWHRRYGESTESVFEVNVYRGETNLYVDLWDADAKLDEFFVSVEHFVPFSFDKLPDILSRCAAVQFGLTELPIFRKALLAFVRWGHGASTIDEFGSSSKDDDLAALRIAQRRAKQ